MSVVVFSSTGCIRCAIVKSYLSECNIEYKEFDIKTEQGNNEFKKFYREHRKSIYRDAEGIFFPIVWNGEKILQDAGSTLACLIAGGALNSMIAPNNLGHGWTGGISLTRGACGPGEAFIEVLERLKRGGLSIEILTDGFCSELLEAVLHRRLVDRLRFEVFVDPEDGAAILELTESLRLACMPSALPELRLFTDIAAHKADDGSFPVPEQIAETARFIREITGNGRLPYVVVNSQAATQAANLLPYRTAARRWQVLTEVD